MVEFSDLVQAFYHSSNFEVDLSGIIKQEEDLSSNIDAPYINFDEYLKY